MSHGFLANFGVRRFPKGNEGKRVSSGYNRRRRLATRSSGKQQAERTAVRTAPIVCPEERTPAFIGSQRFCRKNFTAEPMEWRTDYGAEAQVQPYGVLFCLGRRTEGVQGDKRKAPCKHQYTPTWPEAVPRRCLTRRLRRGRWGCRPAGGSTFFRSERKYQRKLAARRLQRRPAPLRVIRKYRRSGHCRARLLYLLRPASR